MLSLFVFALLGELALALPSQDSSLLHNTTSVLEQISLAHLGTLCRRDAAWTRDYTQGSFKFMPSDVTDRLAATGSFDMEVAWRWAAYFDWGNLSFQRIFQNTRRLFVEHRVKNMVCRRPCEGKKGARVVALSSVDGMEAPAVIFRGDLADSIEGWGAGGCINDTWTLQVADEGPFSTSVQNLENEIRKVLPYELELAQSPGEPVFGKERPTYSRQRPTTDRARPAWSKRVRSLSEHAHAVDKFAEGHPPLGLSGSFGATPKVGSVYLSTYYLHVPGESTVRIPENDSLLMNPRQPIILSLREEDQRSVQEAYEDLSGSPDVKPLLLSNAVADLELQFGRSAELVDITTALMASVGLAIGSKVGMKWVVRLNKATGRQSVVLLLIIALVIAVLDQVAVLTLLITEIIFARKQIIRIGMFSAHRLIGTASSSGFDASREWVVVQRAHSQSHHVGTLSIMFSGLVLLDFIFLLIVARNIRNPEKGRLHPEEMLRVLFRRPANDKKEDPLLVEVFPMERPLDV